MSPSPWGGTVAYQYRRDALYLNITNRCSNDCIFCVRRGPGFSLAGFPMGLTREPTQDEVLQEVERVRAGAGPDRLREVVFCGFGEPTFRLDVLSHVGRDLRSRGFRVRLNTNGQAALLAGRDPFPHLEGALDAVNVSLNAPDPATYLRVCQPVHGPAAWPALLSFARVAADRIPDVVLSVVTAALDDDEVERCAALAARLGLPLRER